MRSQRTTRSEVAPTTANSSSKPRKLSSKKGSEEPKKGWWFAEILKDKKLPKNMNGKKIDVRRIEGFKEFDDSELDDAFIQIPPGQLPAVLDRANANYRQLQDKGFLHFKTYERDVIRPTEAQLLSKIEEMRNGQNAHNGDFDVDIFATTIVSEYVYQVKNLEYKHKETFESVRQHQIDYLESNNYPMHITTETYLDFLRTLEFKKKPFLTFYTVLRGKLPLGEFTRNFNMSRLDNPLQALVDIFEGITDPYSYIAPPMSFFTAHEEDFSCNSISLNYGPGIKIWFILDLENSKKYIVLMATYAALFQASFKKGSPECSKWLQHKMTFTDPQLLRKHGIKFTIVEQKPGDIIVTGAGCIHFGFNLSFNIAVAANVILHDYVLSIPATVMQCKCKGMGAPLDIDVLAGFIRAGRKDFRQKNRKYPEIHLKHDDVKDGNASTRETGEPRGYVSQIQESMEHDGESEQNRDQVSKVATASASNQTDLSTGLNSEAATEDPVDDRNDRTANARSAGSRKNNGENEMTTTTGKKMCTKTLLKSNVICGRWFKNAKTLRNHQKSLSHVSHEEINQSCNLCGKGFTKKCDVKRHLRVCTVRNRDQSGGSGYHNLPSPQGSPLSSVAHTGI